MPVKVAPATDADMSRIFEICALAFDRNEPFFDATWPEHWTEAGRKIGAERMLKAKNSEAQTTFLKGYDDTTGEILGMAKWNVYYPNDFPDYEKLEGKYDEYYPDDEHKKFVDTIVEVFLRDRLGAIERTKGNVVSLDILAVDPKHQRKNVGGALVKWGTDKADELGLEAVVESSVFGRGLYLKNGFEFQKNVVLDLPPQYAGTPEMVYAWLTRPKRAS